MLLARQIQGLPNFRWLPWMRFRNGPRGSFYRVIGVSGSTVRVHPEGWCNRQEWTPSRQHKMTLDLNDDPTGTLLRSMLGEPLQICFFPLKPGLPRYVKVSGPDYGDPLGNQDHSSGLTLGEACAKLAAKRGEWQNG